MEKRSSIFLFHGHGYCRQQGQSLLIPVPAVFPEFLSLAGGGVDTTASPSGVLTPRAELQRAETLAELGGHPPARAWMQLWIRALLKQPSVNPRGKHPQHKIPARSGTV